MSLSIGSQMSTLINEWNSLSDTQKTVNKLGTLVKELSKLISNLGESEEKTKLQTPLNNLKGQLAKRISRHETKDPLKKTQNITDTNQKTNFTKSHITTTKQKESSAKLTLTTQNSEIKDDHLEDTIEDTICDRLGLFTLPFDTIFGKNPETLVQSLKGCSNNIKTLYRYLNDYQSLRRLFICSNVKVAPENLCEILVKNFEDFLFIAHKFFLRVVDYEIDLDILKVFLKSLDSMLDELQKITKDKQLIKTLEARQITQTIEAMQKWVSSRLKSE